MKIKLEREKIDRLSPEDAIPLLIKIRRILLGCKKPDGFTRLIFSINLAGVLLLASWNALSYLALLFSDFIKANKGFSVNAIIRRNGRNLGFEGQDFLEAITTYYFLNIFIWIAVLFALILMYRKVKFYVFVYFSALTVHFFLMFFMIGLQYFIEDVTWFDKIVYATLIISTMIHSALIKREVNIESYH
jgi:hypothetical protein